MRPFKMNDMKVQYLLGIGADAKTIKSLKYNYVTGILYEAPSDYAEVGNACPDAGNCKDLCLGLYAGRAFSMKQKGKKHSTIVEARITRSKMAKQDLKLYTARLKYEISNLIAESDYLSAVEGIEYSPSVRLNGSTDKAIERIYPTLLNHFSTVMFYDYTKNLARMKRFLQNKLSKNYHLTFSRDSDEQFDKKCTQVLNMKGNVSVVFRNKERLQYYIENGYKGFTVVDGDDSDLTFLYPQGVIVGLRAKGSKAKKDKSGFVVD